MAAPSISIKNETDIIGSLVSGNLSNPDDDLNLTEAQSSLSSNEIRVRYTTPIPDLTDKEIVLNVSGFMPDMNDRYLYLDIMNIPDSGFNPLAGANAPGTNPPLGWTQSNGTATVIAADGNIVTTSNPYTNVDGSNLVRFGTNENVQIVRSIDITGYEGDDLIIKVLLNDYGSGDSTLEAGDLFNIDFAFSTSTPSSYTNAITEEGDFVLGSSLEFVETDSTGVTINGGGVTTMWIRVSQIVGSAESWVFDDLRIERVSDGATVFRDSFEAGGRAGTAAIAFEDSSGNSKRYNLTNGIDQHFYYVFDLTATPDSASGSLDLTDIDKIRLILSKEEISGSHSFTVKRLIALEGIQVTDGDSNDPVDTSAIVSYLDVNLPLPSTSPATGNDDPQVKVLRTFSAPHRLFWGNNGAFFFNDNSSGGNFFSNQSSGNITSGFDLLQTANDNSVASGVFVPAATFQQIIISTTTAQTIAGRQFGQYAYRNNSSATLTFQGCSFSGLDAEFGTGIFQNCSFIGFSGAISEGNSYLNSSFIDGTSSSGTLEYSSGLDILGSIFSGNTVAINIPADVTTLNLSNNSFTNNTTDFRWEGTTGNTLTIAVDAESSTDHAGGFNDAGYVAAKVLTPNGGTVTVVAPQPTVTFANIPVTDCYLALYNPDTDPDTEVSAIASSSLSSHQLSYSVVTTNLRAQVIFPPGTFRRIDLVLPVANQTIDVGGIADLTPERNYNNPGLTP